MSGNGFTSPNYTQSPNDWFDEMLPNMGYAECKVTAVLIRHTFGFHRTRVEMGLGRLAKLAGLTERNALVGAKEAEARGIVKRLNAGHGDRRRTVWELIVTTSPREVVQVTTSLGEVVTTSLGEVVLPPLGRQTTSPREGRERKTKERKINEEEEEEKLSKVEGKFLEILSIGGFQNKAQRAAVRQLEQAYGAERLLECAAWAAKRGMGLGHAIVSIEKAIPTWGSIQERSNGNKNQRHSARDGSRGQPAPGRAGAGRVVSGGLASEIARKLSGK